MKNSDLNAEIKRTEIKNKIDPELEKVEIIIRLYHGLSLPVLRRIEEMMFSKSKVHETLETANN